MPPEDESRIERILKLLFQPEFGFPILLEAFFFEPELGRVDDDARLVNLAAMLHVQHFMVHHVFTDIARRAG